MEKYINWSKSLDLIDKIEEKTILELGCGLGTKKLLDKCKKVYSFEVAQTKEWYDKCIEDYKSYNNWHSQFYLMSQVGLDIADKVLLDSSGEIRQTEALKPFYDLLQQFVSVNDKSIDVALVDQGFHLRGETATYFLQRQIPYVIVHDITDCIYIYGYDKIVCPSNYTVKEIKDTRLYIRT